MIEKNMHLLRQYQRLPEEDRQLQDQLNNRSKRFFGIYPPHIPDFSPGNLPGTDQGYSVGDLQGFLYNAVVGKIALGVVNRTLGGGCLSFCCSIAARVRR